MLVLVCAQEGEDKGMIKNVQKDASQSVWKKWGTADRRRQTHRAERWSAEIHGSGPPSNSAMRSLILGRRDASQLGELTWQYAHPCIQFASYFWISGYWAGDGASFSAAWFICPPPHSLVKMLRSWSMPCSNFPTEQHADVSIGSSTYLKISYLLAAEELFKSSGTSVLLR